MSGSIQTSIEEKGIKTDACRDQYKRVLKKGYQHGRVFGSIQTSIKKRYQRRRVSGSIQMSIEKKGYQHGRVLASIQTSIEKKGRSTRTSVGDQYKRVLKKEGSTQTSFGE